MIRALITAGLVSACASSPVLSVAESPSPELHAERLDGPFRELCQIGGDNLDAARCQQLLDQPGEGEDPRAFAVPSAELTNARAPFLAAMLVRLYAEYPSDTATCALAVRTTDGWFFDREHTVVCGNDGSARLSAQAELGLEPIGPRGEPRLRMRVAVEETHMMDGTRIERHLAICGGEQVACVWIPSGLFRQAGARCYDEGGEEGCDEEVLTDVEVPVRIEAIDTLVVGPHAHETAPRSGTYRIAF